MFLRYSAHPHRAVCAGLAGSTALPHSQRCLRRSRARQCRGSCGGRRGVILTGARSKQAADGLRCVKLRKNGLKQTNLLWNLWGDPAPTAARSNAPEWRHRAAHPRGDTEGSNPASARRPRAASLGSAGRQSRSEMNNAEPTRVNPTGGRWMEVTALLSFITEQLPEIQWAR